MGQLRFWGEAISPEDRVLGAIVVLVLALFCVTLVFAVVVLVLRTRNVRVRKRRAGLDARWSEPLLELLGGERAEGTLGLEVKPGEELSFLAFLLPFSRRVKGEEAQALSRVAQPWLPRMERELGRRSAELRALAVQTLGAFGMPAYGPRVVAALDDPSPYVAMTAAQALARREHSEHGPAVVATLWRFSSWSVDLLSAMLARMGPSIAPATRAVLEDRAQPARARAAAAEALRRLNDLVSADSAARVLAEDRPEDPSGVVLVGAALRLLGQVGREGHAAVVRRSLDAPDAGIRAEAVRSYSALASEAEVAALAPRLTDSSPAVSYEVAAALMRVGRSDLVAARAVGGGPCAMVARQALAEGKRRG